jgi:hypothetical protein
MSRLVVSGYAGPEWKAVSVATRKTVDKYCKTHGMKFICQELEHTGRPLPWSKLTCISLGLASHDEVLWLDADVAVADLSKNIFDEVPASFCSAACRLVEQNGEPHFNTGVWVVRRKFLPDIVHAAMQDDLIHHKWWEQAAINRVASDKIFPLPEEWNTWSGSPESVHPRFRHACGLGTPENRLRWLFP